MNISVDDNMYISLDDNIHILVDENPGIVGVAPVVRDGRETSQIQFVHDDDDDLSSLQSKAWFGLQFITASTFNSDLFVHQS